MPWTEAARDLLLQSARWATYIVLPKSARKLWRLKRWVPLRSSSSGCGAAADKRRRSDLSWRIHRQQKSRVDLRQPRQHVRLAFDAAGFQHASQRRQAERLERGLGDRRIAQVPWLRTHAAAIRAVRLVETKASHIRIEPLRQRARIFRRSRIRQATTHGVAGRHRRRVDHIDIAAPVMAAAAGNRRPAQDRIDGAGCPTAGGDRATRPWRS